ncbi:hypothetical protein [Tsuneonella suprasediminis]|uniref:hypothetical protein n=1 Tax=Tsuneonella suprasediminis TaxID=2306996 RepID=UPI001F0B8C3D|nr:hypothetical protein [Tsuneonella suprasediminis]
MAQMLLQFGDDKFGLQEPMALGMGVPYRVPVPLERPAIGRSHDFENFGGETIFVIANHLHIRGVENIGVSQGHSFAAGFDDG